MHLLVDRACLSVAQAGPDFIIMATRTDLPATTTELVVQIDDREKRRTLYLPDGIQSSVNRTAIHPDFPSASRDLSVLLSPP